MVLECIYLRPGFLCGRADHLEDEVQLLQLSLALEQRIPEDDFCHDAAHRPDIQLD
jgi:hypothetical protein